MWRTLASRANFATKVSPRKLLRPYDLALQLKQLSADGDLDAAVRRLRSVPRDAQNVPAWNTMLSLCMSHKRFQLAYTLFIDMKRRGFSPNVSTFVTVFKGFSHISDWSNHPKQLANVHALHQYYLDYTQSIKHHDPGNTAQLSVSPLVIYISILGAVGDIQKIFDVYFAMDQDGPCAPNKFVFTAMLRAMTNHQERTGAMSDTAASHARHVWLQIEKTMEKRPDVELDARLITAALRALVRGRPADQNLALDISARHLGLARPGQPGPVVLSPLLNYWTLDAALQACLAMQQDGLCVHFMRLVMDNLDLDRPAARSTVAKTHVHKLLRAHASLATPRDSARAVDALEWCLKNDAIYDMPELCPDRRTYHLVLMTCFRTTDWNGVVKSFQLMTGIQADSFYESEGEAPPRIQKRAEGRNLDPDVETMSFVLRTALQTEDDTKCLQACWLSEYVGVDKLLKDDAAEPYYRASFARAFVSVVDRLLDDPRTRGRRERLVSLKRRAQKVVDSFAHALKSEKSMQTTLTQGDGASLVDLATQYSKPRSI